MPPGPPEKNDSKGFEDPKNCVKVVLGSP